jgi:hypothetical protein
LPYFCAILRALRAKRKKCCFSNFFLEKVFELCNRGQHPKQKRFSFCVQLVFVFVNVYVYVYVYVFVQVQNESKDQALTTINFVKNHFVEIPYDDQKILKGSLRQKYCF